MEDMFGIGKLFYLGTFFKLEMHSKCVCVSYIRRKYWLFSRTFFVKKQKNYFKRYKDHDVKTGNFPSRTLQWPAKLTVTKNSLSNKWMKRKYEIVGFFNKKVNEQNIVV